MNTNHVNIQELHIGISLPDELKHLLTMANNLWWSFSEEAQELYRNLNPEVWEASEHNPLEVLNSLSSEDLEHCKNDPVFMSRLNDVWGHYTDYMKNPRWFDLEHAKSHPDMLVAYFSMEYGLHESIQIYSGGLGILSGDHCKAATDIGLPLVAVGLLYRHGNFHQYLNTDGWQQEYSPYQEFSKWPVNPVLDAAGQPVIITVEGPNHPVYAKVWEMYVGSVRMILLDTDIDQNQDMDRKITGQLYSGDIVMRIRQEIILGIGGTRALEALDIHPTVYHVNEGHPAFLVLERVKQLKSQQGLDLAAASELVQKSTLFTTHTPVPAGFDLFPKSLIEEYICPIYNRHGISINDIMPWGRIRPNDETESFSMAILGIKMSTFRNGVSKLHGEVARKMFRELWQNVHEPFLPVGHITNGVHLPTWIAEDMQQLHHRYLGENWHLKPYDFSIWQLAGSIPDLELLKIKQQLRARLIGYTREKLKKQIGNRNGSLGELRKAETVLNPDSLTIGFARRFATYKRGYMIFMDEERLAKILNHPEHPVQLIIAGKAHPKDTAGKEIIKKIIHIARKPEFRDRVVFLEDYDMCMARYLAAGVDVWLNTPRRPMEASGTSGMKIAANGGLNLSILDGWWAEGYNGNNGWSIGFGEEYQDQDYQNFVESQELYNKLENEIVPMFYHLDKAGLPRDWIDMMKDAIGSICAFFNTSRMVMEYTDNYYLPLHEQFTKLTRDNLQGLTSHMEWKGWIAEKWPQVKFISAGVEAASPVMGGQVQLKASVHLGDLKAEEVRVYAVLEYNAKDRAFAKPFFVPLEHVGGEGEQSFWQKEYTVVNSGKLRAGFVLVPENSGMRQDFASSLAVWY
ncbi:MAG: alpha-glucan phosphorylase [Deltaproteobacteria bacterium]|nr:MAG: alpha-glucan phosphorylase [Deltaproteobacteria bacterium]